MLGCAILWFIINNNTYFKLLPSSDIHISKGSVVTCVRWGGIIKYEFDATLPLFWKSVNIWGSYGQEYRVMFFWLTAYMSLKWYVFLLSYVVFKRTEILASFQLGHSVYLLNRCHYYWIMELPWTEAGLEEADDADFCSWFSSFNISSLNDCTNVVTGLLWHLHSSKHHWKSWPRSRTEVYRSSHMHYTLLWCCCRWTQQWRAAHSAEPGCS